MAPDTPLRLRSVASWPIYRQGVTGLIYAAIVAAWAAYLVPLALRRHDEKVRARSVQRFSAAMRVLSRPSGAGADPVGALRPAKVATVAAAPRPRASRAAAQRAAARRRRVLTSLVALCVVVGAVVLSGLLPWWVALVPPGLCLGFLAACRWQVRTDAEAYWSDAVARLPASGVRGARAEAMRPTVGDEPNDEPTVVLRRPTAEAASGAVEAPQQVVAVAVPTSDGGSLWDPLPVTLPTYVTKPAAPRTIRTVDVVRPEEPAERDADEVAQPEKDDQPRRAVGQ